MPTIKIERAIVERLLGRPWPARDSDAERQLLNWVKASNITNSGDQAEGALELKFEDTNRADLWSAEGLARQLRTLLDMPPTEYPFLTIRPEAAPLRVRVIDPGLAVLRPYITAFLAQGCGIERDQDIRGLIHVQDKLDETIGRDRAIVSIGIYPAESIKFPIEYCLVDPNAQKMVPLHAADDIPVTLQTILETEKTGKDYGHLLFDAEGRKYPTVPFLRDAQGDPISFPPILNSKIHGQVKVGNNFLMVETTGTDLRAVQLVATLWALNLAERGAEITPCAVEYPYDTPLGRLVLSLRSFARKVTFNEMDCLTVLGTVRDGQPITASMAASLLQTMGYRTRVRGKTVTATTPPFRNDIMHKVDVLEDVALAIGLGEFDRPEPQAMTVGGPAPIMALAERARGILQRCGFQEVASRVSISDDALRDSGFSPADCVEFPHPLRSQDEKPRQLWLRPSLIPGLLGVESRSRSVALPRLSFEVGECVVLDPEAETGSRTQLHVAALVAVDHESGSGTDCLEIAADALAASLDDLVLAPWEGGLFRDEVLRAHESLLEEWKKQASASQLPPRTTAMVRVAEGARLEVIREERSAGLDASEGRHFDVFLGNERVARIGAVGSSVAKAWNLEKPCAVFEVYLDRVLAVAPDSPNW